MQDLNIEVVRKATAVLECLSEDARGFSLHEIAHRLGLVKSSTYRLLLTWERLGYVEKEPSAGHYRLGIKTIELSRKVVGQNRIAQYSRAMLTDLLKRFRESVYLGIYRQQRVVMVDMVESPQPVRVVVDLGQHCYLHASALGRSVAAYLREDSLNTILARNGRPKLTPHTIVSRAKLREILAGIRTRGYAVNREETVEGAVCTAAPFFAGEGGVLGALAISIPVWRATGELIAEVGNALREAAAQLSRQLAGLSAEPDALSRSFEREAAVS